jgi:hypothetical protein
LDLLSSAHDLLYRLGRASNRKRGGGRQADGEDMGDSDARTVRRAVDDGAPGTADSAAKHPRQQPRRPAPVPGDPVTTTERSTDEVTPLAEVERAVQARAKDIALDMGTPAGRSALKELIRDELARWDDDVRRGRRTFPLTNPDIVARRAWRNLAEYGPLTDLLG